VNRKFTKNDIMRMKSLYEQGWTAESIASNFDTTAGYIRSIFYMNEVKKPISADVDFPEYELFDTNWKIWLDYMLEVGVPKKKICEMYGISKFMLRNYLTDCRKYDLIVVCDFYKAKYKFDKVKGSKTNG